jgi:hypothetical protein
VGTVSGRLSRARDQLRARLLRRGIVGPAVLTAAVADSSVAGRAASVALGTTSVSPTVSSLTEGVLATMTTLKWKLAAAVAAGLICIGGVGTYVAMGQSPAKTDSKQQPGTTSGQPKELAVRKVQKLKDGRITAYPDLVLDYSEQFKAPDPGPLTPIPNNIPESDFRQIHFERLRQLLRVIELDNEVLKIGTWDVPFLNQYIINLESLEDAAKKAFPNPAEHISYLRYCVALSGLLDNVTRQRVYVAGNLREQQSKQSVAARLQFEAALYEAEVAAKKAAPPAGGR